METKQYTSYTITDVSPEQQDMWIAMLDDFGFTGFEQNDTSFTATSLQEELDEQAVESFLEENDLAFTKEIIAEKNWNEQWEQSFSPIVVDDFCAVRAAFHAPVPGVKYNIIITPKMSFGTGHHATTYMMMQAMQLINPKGKQVVDFGTGTGILAILADKMGASNVEAIDYDDWCIENGSENIAANNCHNIILKKDSDLQDAMLADVMLANINKNVILANMELMKDKVALNGLLLVSGLLAADEKDIVEAATGNGFRFHNVLHKSGWISILFERKA